MLANGGGGDGVGTDPDTGIQLPNLNIDFAGDDDDDFAGSFGPDECDPWLANFQKILTDGNPDGDNVRQEVPYQPVLPDAVKIRAQVATGHPDAGAPARAAARRWPTARSRTARSSTVPYFFDLLERHRPGRRRRHRPPAVPPPAAVLRP